MDNGGGGVEPETGRRSINAVMLTPDSTSSSSSSAPPFLVPLTVVLWRTYHWLQANRASDTSVQSSSPSPSLSSVGHVAILSVTSPVLLYAPLLGGHQLRWVWVATSRRWRRGRRTSSARLDVAITFSRRMRIVRIERNATVKCF